MPLVGPGPGHGLRCSIIRLSPLGQTGPLLAHPDRLVLETGFLSAVTSAVNVGELQSVSLYND